MAQHEEMVGEVRRFRFTLHRVSPQDPVVEQSGTGVVIDTGRTHDGYCESGTCRLRVTEGPSYRPGEIVQCSIWNTAALERACGTCDGAGRVVTDNDREVRCPDCSQSERLDSGGAA